MQLGERGVEAALCDADTVPLQCVGKHGIGAAGGSGAEGGVSSGGSAGVHMSHYFVGAAAGMAVCMGIGFAVLAYLHCLCGIRFSFVRLRDEEADGGVLGTGVRLERGAAHCRVWRGRPSVTSSPRRLGSDRTGESR